MDVTMSSYSFSHQFSQHWTGAPKPIRDAIVQELTDITDLLQTDTPFEDFVFSVHDLDAHLDELYAAHQIQQAKEQRLADEQAEIARKQAEKEQQEEKEAQAKKAEAEAKIEAERQQQATLTEKSAHHEESSQYSEAKNQKNTIQNNNSAKDNHHAKQDQQNFESHDDADTLIQNAHVNTTIKAVTESANAAIDLSLKDAKLSTAHESMIQELEATIDDYLTEQMLQMSENLKSWLRTEVSRQLSEPSPATDKNNGQETKH